jgi:hypothetical protein
MYYLLSNIHFNTEYLAANGGSIDDVLWPVAAFYDECTIEGKLFRCSCSAECLAGQRYKHVMYKVHWESTKFLVGSTTYECHWVSSYVGKCDIVDSEYQCSILELEQRREAGEKIPVTATERLMSEAKCWTKKRETENVTGENVTGENVTGDNVRGENVTGENRCVGRSKHQAQALRNNITPRTTVTLPDVIPFDQTKPIPFIDYPEINFVRFGDDYSGPANEDEAEEDVMQTSSLHKRVAL